MQSSNHFKYLGIWFSLDLNWEKSTKICVTSALRKLTMLERRRIPIEAKVMVINMVILKAVEYTKTPPLDFQPSKFYKNPKSSFVNQELRLGFFFDLTKYKSSIFFC